MSKGRQARVKYFKPFTFYAFRTGIKIMLNRKILTKDLHLVFSSLFEFIRILNIPFGSIFPDKVVTSAIYMISDRTVVEGVGIFLLKFYIHVCQIN